MPKLGGVVEEDAESIKQRKKAPIARNPKDAHTMALWSACVDFLDRKVLNLPGIRPFFLSRVLCKQCINFAMCLIDENRGNDKHHQKDIENVVNLEMSNETVAALGPVAAPWVAQNKMQPAVSLSQESSPARNVKNISMRTRSSMDGRDSTTVFRHSDPWHDGTEVTLSLFCYVSYPLHPPSSCSSFLSIVLFLVFKNNIILKRKNISKTKKS
jgi:hypothetical protein